MTFSRKFFHTAAALTVSGLTELEATFPEVGPRDPARPVPDGARRRHGRVVLPQLGVR